MSAVVPKPLVVSGWLGSGVVQGISKYIEYIKWSDLRSQDGEGMTHSTLPLIGEYSLPLLFRLVKFRCLSDKPIRGRVGQVVPGKIRVRGLGG